MSTLTDALETLPAIPAPAAVVESTEIDPERLERMRRAFSLRVSGMTPEKIGDELGCSRVTVYRLLNEYKEHYLRELEETPVLHLIAAEIAKLDEIEREARESAQTAKGQNTKNQFLRTALSAAGQRAKFLLETGVIPKEPDKIYSITAEHKPPELREAEKATASREELLNDIEQLVRHGRRI